MTNLVFSRSVSIFSKKVPLLLIMMGDWCSIFTLTLYLLEIPDADNKSELQPKLVSDFEHFNHSRKQLFLEWRSIFS